MKKSKVKTQRKVRDSAKTATVSRARAKLAARTVYAQRSPSNRLTRRKSR